MQLKLYKGQTDPFLSTITSNILCTMTIADIPEIPVLDFELYQPDDLDKQETTKQFLKQLYDTMHDIGFFYIRGHGVPLSLTQAAFKSTSEFFDLPLNEKAKIAMANSPHYRGFTRLSRLSN